MGWKGSISINQKILENRWLRIHGGGLVAKSCLTLETT